MNASGGCDWSVSNHQIGWALVNGGFQVAVYYTPILIIFVVTAKCGNETATKHRYIHLDELCAEQSKFMKGKVI